MQVKRVSALSAILCLVFMICFSYPVAAGQPAIEPFADAERPQPRWKFMSSAGIAFDIDGSDAVFSADCYGSLLAQYSVDVWLINSAGDVVAGPFSNGPNDCPIAGARVTVSEPDVYHVEADFYTHYNGRIVEGQTISSGDYYIE